MSAFLGNPKISNSFTDGNIISTFGSYPHEPDDPGNQGLTFDIILSQGFGSEVYRYEDKPELQTLDFKEIQGQICPEVISPLGEFYKDGDFDKLHASLPRNLIFTGICTFVKGRKFDVITETSNMEEPLVEDINPKKEEKKISLEKEIELVQEEKVFYNSFQQEKKVNKEIISQIHFNEKILDLRGKNKINSIFKELDEISKEKIKLEFNINLKLNNKYEIVRLRKIRKIRFLRKMIKGKFLNLFHEIKDINDIFHLLYLFGTRYRMQVEYNYILKVWFMQSFAIDISLYDIELYSFKGRKHM